MRGSPAVLKMKILLIGKNGQVGWELDRLLRKSGSPWFPGGEGGAEPPVVSMDYPEIDLSRADSIRSALREHEPTLVINAAAYTAVDRAESEPDLAMAVNGIASGILAEEMKRAGGALVHYSTEYVFDGTKGSPYTEEDPHNPLSAYGRSKAAGDKAVRESGCPHLVLRTSWLYGPRGSNFLLTMLRLARERVELRVVNDQIGAPTWARFVARSTCRILALSVERKEKGTDLFSGSVSGTYNLTSGGHTTWYGFAQRLLELDPRKEEQIVEHILPIATSEYPAPARRPLNCRLDCTRVRETFGIEPPPWEDSLRQVMAEL